MTAAGKTLQAFGRATVESGKLLHMSLNYLCCYSDVHVELKTIKAVLSKIEWPPLNVSFDRAVWRIDGAEGSTPTLASIEHQSILVLLDEQSQRLMHSLVADIETRIRAAGVDIHVPRAEQEPFHSTLGVVSGRSFPAEAALAAVRRVVPHGSWTPSGPITLSAPTINF
jgi:hypothetical protein